MDWLREIESLLRSGRRGEAHAAYRRRATEHPVSCEQQGRKANPLRVLRLMSDEGVVFTNVAPVQFTATGHFESDHLLAFDDITVSTFHILNETNPASIVEAAQQADIVLNCIADPDVHSVTLRTAAAACRQITIPIMNRPARILRHTRDAVAAALVGIDGLVVPNTIRTRTPPKHVTLPVITRRCGTQTGQSMELIADVDALKSYFSKQGGESYLIPFVDFRSGDGFYRKYRVRIVGTDMTHNHLFLGEHWRVHGRSARALAKDHPWMDEEENKFLGGNHPASNATVHRVLLDIHKRVGTQFYGIDYSVLPDGQVLFFEANAAMRSIYPEWRESHPRTKKITNTLARSFHKLLHQQHKSHVATM